MAPQSPGRICLGRPHLEGGLEIATLVEYSPCKYEDLSLSPRTIQKKRKGKKPGTDLHVCNPRAERTERLRQADPWDFLAINSRAVADPVSENKVDDT